VAFPATGSAAPSTGFNYVNVTLASLALQTFPNVTGAPWTKLLHRYETATYSGGGSPTNAATLLTLATQIATDWYSWQLAKLDQYFTGTIPWNPEGFHDLEWRQQGGKITTHVQRTNIEEDLVNLAADTADLTSPLTTKGDIWGFSTVNARIPVGTNTQVLTADSTQTLGVKWAASGGTTPTFITSPTTGTATGPAFTAALGTTGTDLNWAAASSTLTLNVPDASTTARGVVNDTVQFLVGYKTIAYGEQGANGFSVIGGAPGSGGAADDWGVAIGMQNAVPQASPWGGLSLSNTTGIAFSNITSWFPEDPAINSNLGYLTVSTANGSGGLDGAFSIFNADGVVSQTVSPSFSLPAVGSTANATVSSTSRMTANMKLALTGSNAGVTDDTLFVLGHVVSVTSGTVFVFQTDIIYRGTVGHATSISQVYSYQWYKGATGTLGGASFHGGLYLGGGSLSTTANLTAQNATVSSVVTATSPNDANAHQYEVGAYLDVTAISAGTVTLTCTYTDENSTGRTLTMFPMGLTSAGVTGTGFVAYPSATIRVKANTAITVVATFTGVSVTYDVGGNIRQVD
jgi:hypothetical protein